MPIHSCIHLYVHLTEKPLINGAVFPTCRCRMCFWWGKNMYADVHRHGCMLFCSYWVLLHYELSLSLEFPFFQISNFVIASMWEYLCKKPPKVKCRVVSTLVLLNFRSFRTCTHTHNITQLHQSADTLNHWDLYITHRIFLNVRVRARIYADTHTLACTQHHTGTCIYSRKGLTSCTVCDCIHTFKSVYAHLHHRSYITVCL